MRTPAVEAARASPSETKRMEMARTPVNHPSLKRAGAHQRPNSLTGERFDRFVTIFLSQFVRVGLARPRTFFGPVRACDTVPPFGVDPMLGQQGSDEGLRVFTNVPELTGEFSSVTLLQVVLVPLVARAYLSAITARRAKSHPVRFDKRHVHARTGKMQRGR